MSIAPEPTSEVLKRCCALAYEGDWVRLLLGDTFHPGGRELTRGLVRAMALRPGDLVLDVASGTGATAVLLAREFGVMVNGVDLSERSIQAARRRAAEAGLDDAIRFVVADAERLPVVDRSVDAVVCECSMCLFPDKAVAAWELARVLRSGGRLGISDVVAAPEKLPEDLRGFAARVACLADARPLDEYAGLVEDAGLKVSRIENHDEALHELIERVDSRLAALEVLDVARLSGVDFSGARRLLRIAAQSVRDGAVGYALLVAENP